MPCSAPGETPSGRGGARRSRSGTGRACGCVSRRAAIGDGRAALGCDAVEAAAVGLAHTFLTPIRGRSSPFPPKTSEERRVCAKVATREGAPKRPVGRRRGPVSAGKAKMNETRPGNAVRAGEESPNRKEKRVKTVGNLPPTRTAGQHYETNRSDERFTFAVCNGKGWAGALATSNTTTWKLSRQGFLLAGARSGVGGQRGLFEAWACRFGEGSASHDWSLDRRFFRVSETTQSARESDHRLTSHGVSIMSIP